MPDRLASWRWTLAVQAAVLQMSSVAVRLMIGYQAIDVGAHTVALGAVATSYAVPGLFMAFPAGRAADRLGGVRLTTVGIAALALGAAFCAASPTLALLMAGCVIVGVGQVLILVGQQSCVAEQASSGQTDSAFGMLTSSLAVGQVAGPPAVAWLATAVAGTPDHPNTRAALLVAAAVCLLVLPTHRLLPRASEWSHRPTSSSGRTTMATLVVLPGMWRALIVGGVVLTALDLVYAFVPVWATANQVDISTVGWLLALRAGVSVVSRVGLGRLVAILGRKLLLLTALTIAAAGLAGLAYADITGSVLIMVALGFGLGLPQPLTMSWVVERSGVANRGAALGLRLTINRLLQVVMPVAVGVVAAPFGVGAVFLGGATLVGGITVVVATSGRGLDVARAEGPPV